MATKPEFLKIYKTPEETLAVWAKQMNHILSNLINTGYVNIALTANDINAVPDTRKVNGKQLNADITLSYSDVGAASANILSSGITQNITIPDKDNTNYHHFTFTTGILTAYVKNTTP